MNSGNSNSNSNITSKSSILPYFTTFLIIICIITFAAVFYEQNVPIYRTTFMSPILAVLAAIAFMYFIYIMRDRQVDLFGKKIDTGVVVYIFILALVFYVLGG